MGLRSFFQLCFYFVSVIIALMTPTLSHAQPSIPVFITAKSPVSVFTNSGYNSKSCKESGNDINGNKFCEELNYKLKPGEEVNVTSPPITLPDPSKPDADALFMTVENANVAGYIRADQTDLYTEALNRQIDPNLPIDDSPDATTATTTEDCVDCIKPRNEASTLDNFFSQALGTYYDPNAMSEADRQKILAAQLKNEEKETAVKELAAVIESKLQCVSENIKPVRNSNDGISDNFAGYSKALKQKVNQLKKTGEISFDHFTTAQLYAADSAARTFFGEMGTSQYQCHEKGGSYHYKVVARISLDRVENARQCVNSPYVVPNMTCAQIEEALPIVFGSHLQYSMYNKLDPQFKVAMCVDLKNHPENKKAWQDAARVAAETIINPDKIRKSTGGDKFDYSHYSSKVKPWWTRYKGWREGKPPVVDGQIVADKNCLRVWQSPEFQCIKRKDPCPSS